LLGASVEGFFYGRPSSAWPTLTEAVGGIVSLGLGVEFWAFRGEGDPGPTSQTVEEIRCICEKAPFVSMHTHRELWRWNPDGLKREIALCHAVGARTLVLHKGSLGLYDPSSRPDFPAIRRLLQVAQEAGVKLALENGLDSLWALDRVLDEIGHDPAKTNLGICIDVGHAHLAKDAGRQPIRNYLERYRGQLIHLHLHDNLQDEDDHRLPGEGSIDWSDLLRTLGAIGYEGPAVLELHSAGDPLTALKKGCEFFDALV